MSELDNHGIHIRFRASGAPHMAGHDIDDLVVSWLVRGVKVTEETAREAVAEIRWTERRHKPAALVEWAKRAAAHPSQEVK